MLSFANEPVTCVFTLLTLVVTVGCELKVLSPMSLYYSIPLILKGQVWRLFTHFFVFGSSVSLDFFLTIAALVRYSQELEARFFRNRAADYLWFAMLGMTAMNIVAPFMRAIVMSGALSFMVVYVWARRSPDGFVALLGIFAFRTRYLPWVLLALSALSGSELGAPLTGLACGHIYYFLEDVYPVMTPSRSRPLATPMWFRRLLSILSSIIPTPIQGRGQHQQQQQRVRDPALAELHELNRLPQQHQQHHLGQQGLGGDGVVVVEPDPEVVRRNLEIAARLRAEQQQQQQQQQGLGQRDDDNDGNNSVTTVADDVAMDDDNTITTTADVSNNNNDNNNNAVDTSDPAQGPGVGVVRGQGTPARVAPRRDLYG